MEYDDNTGLISNIYISLKKKKYALPIKGGAYFLLLRCNKCYLEMYNMILFRE